jgi:hypothetical protein
MKLSIWRQFSSNHSGSFAVVGRFANEDQAKAAADKLADIIHRIDQWHENPDNQAWYEEEAPSGALTAVEEAIRTEFALNEWDHQAADWYGEQGHDPVRRVGRDVFFSVGETWSSPQPIHNLIEKLGGTPYDQHEFGGPITNIFVTLTCAFASLEIAEQTDALLRPWFDDLHGYPPWAADDSLYGMGFGQVSREGVSLKINLDDRIETLPDLLAWLRSRGAHDLDYSLEMRNTYPE